MKKQICLIMAIILCFGLTSCSKLNSDFIASFSKVDEITNDVDAIPVETEAIDTGLESDLEPVSNSIPEYFKLVGGTDDFYLLIGWDKESGYTNGIYSYPKYGNISIDINIGDVISLDCQEIDYDKFPAVIIAEGSTIKIENSVSTSSALDLYESLSAILLNSTTDSTNIKTIAIDYTELSDEYNESDRFGAMWLLTSKAEELWGHNVTCKEATLNDLVVDGSFVRQDSEVTDADTVTQFVWGDGVYLKVWSNADGTISGSIINTIKS